MLWREQGKRDNAIFKSLNVRMQGYVGDSRDYINIVTSFFKSPRRSFIPDHPCARFKAQILAACRGPSH